MKIKVNGREPFAPGNLYAGGFACVPVGLMLYESATPVHIAAYAALSSCADKRTAVVDGARLRRLYERSRMSRRTLQRSIDDLASWGFVAVDHFSGRPSRYTLLAVARPDLFGPEPAPSTTRVQETTRVMGDAGPPPEPAPSTTPTRVICAPTRVMGDTTPQNQIQNQIQRDPLSPEIESALRDRGVEPGPYRQAIADHFGRRLAEGVSLEQVLHEVDLALHHAATARPTAAAK